MRDFTEEEKEKIISTPITMECFDKWLDYHYEEIKVEHFPRGNGKTCTVLLYPTSLYESLIEDCEVIRRKYLETKNKHYFDVLVRLLPNSYKVVDLCNGVKKDSQGFPDRYCEVEITMQDGSVIYGKYDPAIGFMNSGGGMIWKEKVAEYKVVKL